MKSKKTPKAEVTQVISDSVIHGNVAAGNGNTQAVEPSAREKTAVRKAPQPVEQTAKSASAPSDFAPIVFISYSHDNDAHKANVRGLAERLRSGGIDCRIDQWIENPSEGWPNWMRRQLREATFVLVVCSATYRSRVDGTEKPGKGKGAKFEGLLLTQQILDSDAMNDTIVPVLFDGSDDVDIPDFLLPYTRYYLPRDDDKLYRRIINDPEIVPPPLGQIVRTGPRKPTVGAKTDPSALKPVAHNADVALFRAFIELLPPTGNIHWLRTANFAGFSFDPANLSQVDALNDNWRGAAFEFVDKEVNKHLAKLKKLVGAFEEVIATQTWSTRTGRQSVPPEWELERPQHFEEVVGRIHKLADQIVRTYDALVRTAREKLGASLV